MLIVGVEKDEPVPKTGPPDEDAYQLNVPVPEAERFTEPEPHRFPSVAKGAAGVVFTVA